MKNYRWLGIAIGLTLLALVLQAGLVAFAGYVLIGVYLLSRYLAKNWIVQLEAERKVDQTPREVGEVVEVVVKLKNTGKLPIGWLLVEDMLPEFALRQKPPRLTIKGKRIIIAMIGAGKTKTVKYKITFKQRGYYQLGPTFAETGDVFGLHRRHRILSNPAFVLVYPRILHLSKYQFSSKRPIGEIRLANRLFEDPTRTAGVRPYVMGDPLQRIHWRATARTGALHSRIYEPTSLAGATVLLDFHSVGYFKRGEPYRSELAISAACALAYAVSLMNQQIGLASNGRDTAARIREEASVKIDPTSDAAEQGTATREEARANYEALGPDKRLQPVVVETRRGIDQFSKIRDALARLELTDGMTFTGLILEAGPRLPKDATILAILPQVSVETSVALGQLRRQGYAISAILVGITDDDKPVFLGRLAAEGIRDVRFIHTEDDLQNIGDAGTAGPSTYNVAVTLA